MKPWGLIFSLCFIVLFSVCAVLRAEDSSLKPEPDVKLESEVKPELEVAENWKPFALDETLDDWSIPGFGGEGEVCVKDGELIIGLGVAATGIKYKKDFPKSNYEIRYEAKRTKGYDFFGALTFPVGNSFCSFINGGWGGGVVGLSCIDGYDASENQTSQYYSFKSGKWYKFRVVVTDEKIMVWIGDEEKKPELKIDVDLKDKKINTRLESRPFEPLGLTTWCSEGIIKDFKYRELKPEDVEKIKQDEEKIKQESKKSS